MGDFSADANCNIYLVDHTAINFLVAQIYSIIFTINQCCHIS